MAAPKNLQEFCEKFAKIKAMGWIASHREGSTGIGKTLEDLLEIDENNSDAADFADYELKAMRTNGGDAQLLTLLTRSPLPKGVNAKLLATYGYSSNAYDNDRKVLHATISCGHLAKVDGTGKFLTVDCRDDKIRIVDGDGVSFAYWTAEILEKAFAKKYPKSMIHVYADSQGGSYDEQFLFHTAYELSGFSFGNMQNLLKEGLLKVDIRIGQHKDGSPHDHGTGFRLKDRDLTRIFAVKRELI